MYQTFNISLFLSKKIDGSQIYYKIDGERFKESKTLKLQVDTTYRLSLECKPALDISNISICGIKVEGSATKNDASLSNYVGTWSSVVPKTSNKVRSFLPVTIVFEDGAKIETSIQCKVYSLKDKTHVIWGSPLKSLDLRCSRKKGDNIISVIETTFV